MKKQILFLMAGGALALASCNNEGAGGYTDAQVDSMVNARVELIQAELEAKNDSLINALAQWKADSIIAASKGGTVKKAAPARPATTTTKKEEPQAPAVDPQKARNNQNTSAEDQKSRNNQNTSAEDQKRRNNQR